MISKLESGNACTAIAKLLPLTKQGCFIYRYRIEQKGE